ncbi:hypothetical protein MAR_021835 [Mya arenaria]|uniref:Uncharacterized protein n=1 Tax=Mya arenaria TaxID=6604 RepID=A0ABY7ECP0_MYAAR|nr:hypothetical protein MAR_021835 [Mya arenaria]
MDKIIWFITIYIVFVFTPLVNSLATNTTLENTLMPNTPMISKLITNTIIDNTTTAENRSSDIAVRAILATLLCRVEQLISMKENGEETVVSRRVCFN